MPSKDYFQFKKSDRMALYSWFNSLVSSMFTKPLTVDTCIYVYIYIYTYIRAQKKKKDL